MDERMGHTGERFISCRTLWSALMALSVLSYIGCTSSSVAFREGRKAEEQKDYDLAVVDFDKALQTQPNNPNLLIYEKRARTEASLAHLKRGRGLLQENRPEEAGVEFEKAASIDPSNQAAARELRQILAKQAARRAWRERAIRNVMAAKAETETTGVELKPLSRTIIPVLHLSANSKEVFEALGKIAGINVGFYHDFQSRPISIDMSDTTIEDILRMAAAEAGVFWKVITPNTILIIPDTPMNRQNLETNVLKTIYLQNPMEVQDRMAILTAVKQVIGLELKAFDNPEANAIVLYGTPEKVNEAQRLIHGLDRGQAEVLIDVDVLEADKSYVRALGLEPAPITGNTLAELGFNPSTTTSSGTPYVSLNQLGKISTRDFSVVLSGVVADALLTDSRTHILQSPQVRVMAGQKATLKIGEQVPYATGSFGVPTGSSASSLLTNTQFNYKDTGVDLIMQPFVAANGEIVIHAKVTISAVGPSSNIAGVEEPSFTDREVEHVIRLKEGQTSLLGGLIQTETIRTATGLPGLAEIPVLKYFFSDQEMNAQDTEVLIMMTPHLVRLSEPVPAYASNHLLRRAARANQQ